MGSCVSVHKDPDSIMKLRFSIGSKNEKLLIPSPVKLKPTAVNAREPTLADVVKSHWSPAPGSKDEAFFDSQPWLESDCEDDFYSVIGDSTPSRGSTPVHHNFSSGTLLVNKPSMEGAVDSVPSPPDKKKRLSELFLESLRSDEYADEDLLLDDKKEAQSANGTTPYFSGGSDEKTPNRVLKDEEKPLRSAQCCLPNLLSSRSFSERKKRTSPTVTVA